MTERKYAVEQVASRIERFLGPVIAQAGFQLNYRIEEGHPPHPDFENPEVLAKFSGPDVDLLLENKAELLLALEQLTMEVLRMPAEHHSLLCFDANDYRALRIEELRLSASAAADKVRRTRIPFTFSPMNSRERRIVHLAMRNEPDVRSESTGMGPHRQVVIYPAGMSSSSAPPRPYGRGRRR